MLLDSALEPRLFAAFVRGMPSNARQQAISVLNIRADKILDTKVETLFYDADIGIAPITPESMTRFAESYHSNKAADMRAYVAANPETLYLDFEPTLTAVEQMPTYEAILRAARDSTFQSAAHKGFLACALILHAMRGHEMLSATLQQLNPLGVDRWEYLWLLRQAWASRSMLARAVTPLALGEWTLWRTPDHTFPTCDSPILIDKDSVMAILSPRLLLTIDLQRTQDEADWILKDTLPTELASEVRRRSAIPSKQSHFPTGRSSQSGKPPPEYKERKQLLTDPASRGECQRMGVLRILYLLAGAGRVPDDFETWIDRVFDRPGADTLTKKSDARGRQARTADQSARNRTIH